MKIELILPLPVTLNKLTHNNRAKNGGKGGRSKTKRAKDWYRDAQYHAMPFVKGNQAECNKNINTRNKYWEFGKKTYNLQRMQNDHKSLSYRVTYKYFFENDWPRDLGNYEKQLSDFLVDIGMMLDDLFITELFLMRLPNDIDNPRVECLIEVINKHGACDEKTTAK